VLSVIVGCHPPPSSAVCLGTKCWSLLTNVVPGHPPRLPLLIVLLGYFQDQGPDRDHSLGTQPASAGRGEPGWSGRRRWPSATATSSRRPRETGEKTWRIITWEIVPNEVSLIAASFVNTVLYAIGAFGGPGLYRRHQT